MYEWFINIRGSLKGPLLRGFFYKQMSISYETCLAQPVDPPKEHPVFSNKWICGWMREYAVSLRKRNKRCQIKLEGRAERI